MKFCSFLPLHPLFFWISFQVDRSLSPAPCEGPLATVSTVEGAKLVAGTNDAERLKEGQEYLTPVFLRAFYP